MTTIIIVILLVLAGMLAIRSACRHMSGKGGCCGDSGSEPPEFKKLEGPEIGRYLVRVDGMHCVSCKNTVEHAVNQLKGAVGTVVLERGLLTVHCEREIAEEQIRKAVGKAGYEILEMEYESLQNRKNNNL